MDPARKAKLGERWVCFSCAAKFYDLHKPEPLCPKCGANQHESPMFKKKPKRAKKASKKAALPPAPIIDEMETESETELEMESDDDSNDELDLDDLEMGEDEDLSGVEVDED